MNVVIVGNFWFPRGTASAARVRNLALGLRESGARVHVMSMAPHPPIDGRRAGTHEGITYECLAPVVAATEGWRDAARTLPRLRRRLFDRILWFGGLYGAAPIARRRLRDRIRRGECDVVVAYDRSFLRMAPLASLCRAHRVTAVLDVVEVAEHLRRRGLNPVYWDALAGTRRAPRHFAGLTVITTGLEAAFRAAGCLRTLVLPALEAFPAAPPPEPTGNRTFRLAYVGALEPRDAPEMLFETMRVLAGQGRAVSLDVIGHYDGTERGRLFVDRCAEDSLLRSTVLFRGSLGDEALASCLSRADGLLLTRRDADTEVLSFPTRLVEYLRYGRPVFATDVGDVSRYLRDGAEAALLHPRDPVRAAAAIAKVAESPDRGAELGRKGRAAGARAFDRRVHAVRFLEFAARLRAGVAA